MDLRSATYKDLYGPSTSHRDNAFIIPGRAGVNMRPSRGNVNGSAPRRPPQRNRRERNMDNDHFREPAHHSRERTNSDSFVGTSLTQNDIAEYIYYFCPKCKNHYNYFKNYYAIHGRVPRILPCGHTMCEACINGAIKTKNQLCCATCLESIIIKKQQALDYNHYVVGQITCSKINQATDIPNINLMSTGMKVQKSNDVLDSILSEERCSLGACKNIGTVSCVDCCGVYCIECDNALHNSGKHLKSHKRHKNEKVCFDLNKCPHHSMLKELYCKDCDKNCCCYCILENHEGHTRSYLFRLNEEEEIELKEAYIKVTENLKWLQQKFESCKKYEVDKISHIDIEIGQIFSDIHAKLYQIEKKLREEAKTLENCYSLSDKSNRIFSNHIETLKYLIKCIDQREEMKLNLKDLLKKAKEMENLPKTLLTGPTDCVTKVIVDDRIKELGDYFKLDISSNETCEFKHEKNLLEDYKFEQDSASRKNEALPKCQPETSKANSEMVLEKMVKKHRKKYPKDEHKNNIAPETVFITYLESLDCFFVQFKKEEEEFKKLKEEIHQYVEGTELGVKSVEINELYVAPLSLTNNSQWGRVRVVKEIEKDNDIQYQVDFIDFGNSLIFGRNELKQISSSLAKHRPFAFKCRLHNPSVVQWAKDSHLKLASLLNGNMEFTMFTRDYSNNVYTVDLSFNSSLGGCQSVSDLLIIGCDALQTDSYICSSSALSHLNRSSISFSKGENHEIFIRYVLDPWNIYVQKSSRDDCLTDLMKSLKKYYEHSECDIGHPVNNSHVVILYPSKDYGNWHRACIEDVFINKKIVKVYLVDWGKRVNISWKHLRQLNERFSEIEYLVVGSKLADIDPLSENGWSHLDAVDARTFLEKYSKKLKPMKMLVTVSDPLEIVLFDKKDTFDENINALLVEHHLALSTGKLSQTVKWLHEEGGKLNKDEFHEEEDKLDKVEFHGEEDKLDKDELHEEEDKLDKVEFHGEEDKLDEDELHEEEYKLDKDEFSPILYNFSEDDDSDEEEVQGIKLQVAIVRFDNPYSIYVSLVSRSDEAKRLDEELQIHYSQELDVQDSWNINDKVVVFDNHEKSYYRGKIQRIEDTQYCVYLLDRGDSIWVFQKDLRRISHYFCSAFPNMVLKCRLANIKPAGDSQNWGKMSIEWFQKLFARYKDVYLRKVFDDKSRSSMPVTMWYSRVTQGTALEPSIGKLISIDKKVIKAGLAFRQISIKSVAADKVIETSKEPDLEKLPLSKVKADSHVTLEAMMPSSLVEDRPASISEELVEKGETDLQQEAMISQKILEWLPPIPIKDREFYAYVTCAESSGFLFIRHQDLQVHYETMKANMKEHFDAIPKTKPFELRENQLVTIWCDNFWYRGTVLNVIDKTTAKVIMVDYGSDHIVKIDHLHNKIMYPEIPVMATKIRLYDVYSKAGRWSAEDTDILLESVSEYSKIVIRSSLTVDIPLADVYCTKGVCLNDKIVELSANLYRSKQKENQSGSETESCLDVETEVIEAENSGSDNSISTDEKLISPGKDEYEEIIDDVKDYIYAKLPLHEKIKLNIISVFNYKTLSLFFANDQAKEEDFEALSKTLQEEGPNLEPLTEYEVGMPCISLFQEDNQWYRAKIFDLDALGSGYATVIYVDYGNLDIVNVSDIKPIKNEWLHFPSNFVVAQINCRLIQKQQEQYLLRHMERLIGKSKLVEIINESPVKIHIYEDDGDKLYYDLFVKNSVVELLK